MTPVETDRCIFFIISIIFKAKTAFFNFIHAFCVTFIYFMYVCTPKNIYALLFLFKYFSLNQKPLGFTYVV